MNLGYLSPDGKFYTCNYWEHMSLAVRICHEITGTEFYSGFKAEQYLLDIGYLVIRSRNIGYNSICSKEYGDSINCDKTIVNLITTAQHNYIRELFNNNSWSNLDQLDSMNEVLKTDSDFKRWLPQDDDLVLNPALNGKIE